MTMKYRRKPQTVLAYQVQPLDDEQTRQLPPPWLVQALVDGVVTGGAGNTLTVRGGHTASVGDYIVRTESGHLSAWPKAEFEAVFELDAPQQ